MVKGGVNQSRKMKAQDSMIDVSVVHEEVSPIDGVGFRQLSRKGYVNHESSTPPQNMFNLRAS